MYPLFFSLGWIYWYTLPFMIPRFQGYKKIITHLLAKNKISRCQFANPAIHTYLIFHILQLYNRTLSTSQNTRDSLKHCTIKIQEKNNVWLKDVLPHIKHFFKITNQRTDFISWYSDHSATQFSMIISFLAFKKKILKYFQNNGEIVTIVTS